MILSELGKEKRITVPTNRQFFTRSVSAQLYSTKGILFNPFMKMHTFKFWKTPSRQVYSKVATDDGSAFVVSDEGSMRQSHERPWITKALLAASLITNTAVFISAAFLYCQSTTGNQILGSGSRSAVFPTCKFKLQRVATVILKACKFIKRSNTLTQIGCTPTDQMSEQMQRGRSSPDVRKI